MNNLQTPKVGMTVFTDDGFTCIGKGKVIIHSDENGFYFPCEVGRHYLDGQLSKDENGDPLFVGLYVENN